METIPTTHYPRVTLTKWASDDSHQGTNQERAEWLEAIPKLGFELLFERKFEGLDSKLRQHQRLLAKKTHQANRQSFSDADQEHWIRWWRHPSGILASVSMFRDRPDMAWMFNSVDLIGRVDHGFCSLEKTNFSGFHEEGHDLERVGGPRSDIAKEWERLRIYASRGQLIPLDQWEAITPRPDLLASQEWLWPVDKLKMAELDTPIAQAASAVKLRGLHAVDLVMEWIDEIQKMDVPPAEKTLWTQYLIHETLGLNRNKTTAKKIKALPKWMRNHVAPMYQLDPLLMARQSFRRNASTLALHETMKEFGLKPGDPLTREERARVAKWLNVMCDLRHPSLIGDDLEQAVANGLPRLGMEFHHVLFKAADQRGVMGKLLWWQERQDADDLSKLCQVPDADGRTLPMRWTDVWERVPNERINERAQRQRAVGAAKALCQIEEKLPAAQWTLATPTRSIWDGAICAKMNIPFDGDLLGAHSKAMGSMLQWLSQLDCVLPKHLFVPGRAEQVQLQDMDAMVLAITQAITNDQLPSAGTAIERCELTAPIVARFTHDEMQRSMAPASVRIGSMRL
jgi:hypothetical protein